jgi:hypothetical protein
MEHPNFPDHSTFQPCLGGTSMWYADKRGNLMMAVCSLNQVESAKSLGWNIGPPPERYRKC